MIVQPYTHVGIVVPDLTAAAATMTEALGIEWCEVLQWSLDVWTPDGISTITSQFTYSRGPQPRIEILQSVPGTLWESDRATDHHVGYWSTELRDDGARLEQQGHQLIGTLADDPGSPTGFGYYQHPAGGPLIEIVDAALIPRFERWWSGGRF